MSFRKRSRAGSRVVLPRRPSLGVGLALLALTGCGQIETRKQMMADPAAPAPSAAMPMEMGRSSQPAMGGMPMGGHAKSGAGAALTTLRMSALDRMLIRDATVTLETDAARKAVDALSVAARAMGGYVGDTTEEVDPIGVRTVTVQLRVPAARFDDLMRVVEHQGTVLHRHIGTQDVTEEFIDVDAKLRNLKRTEERLLTHLSRTGKLADTLAVERELARVRLEIELYEGRMRFLKHNVSFSTATVTCNEKARSGPVVPPHSFSSGEVVSSAARSLVDFARGLWSWAIWACVWAPVWAPLLAAVWCWRRRRRVAASRAP